MRERGVALLMLLIGLLGLAGLAAVGSLQPGGPVPSALDASRSSNAGGMSRRRSPGAALHDRRRALRARDALLAHTTLYADLYGATGAGPGHFSCPDRDVPVGTDAAARALGGVGPDPPCGARPRVSGVLPAHVTVGAVRSVLDVDAHDGRALAYELSAEVVNNPIDRPVNARLTGRALASIGGSVTIDARQVVPPVTARVAAWVAERLSTVRARTVDDIARQLGDCDDAPCPVLPFLVQDGGLDGVPVHRHWFVRNGWTADVDVRVDRRCTGVADTPPVRRCTWRPTQRPDRPTVRLSPDAAS